MSEIDFGARFFVERLRDEEQEQMPARRYVAPVLYKVTWSGVCNASGFGIFVNTGIGLEGPTQGHIWYIRRVSVGAQFPGQTVTSGRFDIFISAADYSTYFTTLQQFGMGDWQDGTATIPSNAFYTRGAMPLRLNEALTFVASGCPANQQLGGQFVLEDYEEAALDVDWMM